MSYNPTCDTETIIRVNGTRLPAGDVDIHARKEGPLAITRYAEAEFASPWNDEDYLSAFNGVTDDSQSDWDVLEVELLDTATETYNTVFRGMVTGVGNSADGNEKMWQCRAQGPGHFVNKIPAGKRFQGASINRVLGWIGSQLVQNLPIEIRLSTDEGAVQPDETADVTLLSLVGRGPGDGSGKTKTFKKNRHTVADVVKWVEEKTQSRIWFAPEDDYMRFFGTTTPTERKHEAHYLGGDLRVISNDALTELNPINSMTVKGKAATSLGEVGDFEINVGSNEYYAATAVHKRLLKRAGGQQYWGDPHTPSDAESAEEVRNVAKSELKKKIDKTTGGDMITQPRSPIRPFDTIRARPTCRESPATDTDPIEYEVSRVHHQIRTEEQSQTKLNVGIHASFDDIILTEGGWESVTS